MPGVGCQVLNVTHQVTGMDVHNAVPPPPPAGPLPLPHAIVATLGQAMPATAKTSATVMAGPGFAVARKHDLGIGTYHIPLAENNLLPIVCLGGGNKAEFGVSSVFVAVGQKEAKDSGKLAVACIPGQGINLQLDCNDVPGPAPTSKCDASMNTVQAGFTVGDFMGGFAAMAADIIITKLVSVAAEWAAKEGMVVVGAMFGPEGVLIAGLVAEGAIPGVVETVALGLGWVIGSPLGYSPSWAPMGNLSDKLNDAVDDFFSPTPTSGP